MRPEIDALDVPEGVLQIRLRRDGKEWSALIDSSMSNYQIIAVITSGLAAYRRAFPS